MEKFQLNANNNTLLVFIDETGCEDLKDPRNPSFGRAGCAIKAAHYENLISAPWKKMKNELFGGEHKPWHTADIKFSESQIEAVNQFVDNSFCRFGQICTNKTFYEKPFTIHNILSESFVSWLCRV